MHWHKALLLSGDFTPIDSNNNVLLRNTKHIADQFEIEDTAFRVEKVKFVLLEQDQRDDEAEWSIPEQDTFDYVVMTALNSFSDDRPDIIHTLAHSSTGWNTGVGLLVFHTSDMQLVDGFLANLKQTKLPSHQSLHFLPKLMILNKYSLSIYFGPNFAPLRTSELILWLGICNNLEGKHEVHSCRTETRNGGWPALWIQRRPEVLRLAPQVFPGFPVHCKGWWQCIYQWWGIALIQMISGPRIKRSSVRQLMLGVQDKIVNQPQEESLQQK